MGQNTKIHELLADKQALLFDMDGTLVDSNDLHAEAWTKALEKFGYPVPFEQVRALIGKGGDKMLPELTGIDAESSEGMAISEYRSQLFIDHYAPKVKAFPDTTDLLTHLKHQGKKLVIATSANKKELTAILKNAGLEDCFSTMTTSSDAEESKPDPDIIKAALSKAGASAADALMIGDTPYDIEAGMRAGTSVIAFRSGGWSAEELGSAAAIYDNPSDMLKDLKSQGSGQNH